MLDLDFCCHFACAHGKLGERTIPLTGADLPQWPFLAGFAAAEVIDDLKGFNYLRWTAGAFLLHKFPYANNCIPKNNPDPVPPYATSPLSAHPP